MAIFKLLIKNIKDSYKHIPYTLKHRKKLLELEEIFTGKRSYYFHDLDKVIMYALFPYLGTKIIYKIHARLNKHHVKYWRGINKMDKVQAVLDWESARYTKPDKPMNAAETLVYHYPHLISEFEDTFASLGLEEQLNKTVDEWIIKAGGIIE